MSLTDFGVAGIKGRPISKKTAVSDRHIKGELNSLESLCFHYRSIDYNLKDGEVVDYWNIGDNCYYLSGHPEKCIGMCSNWKSFNTKVMRRIEKWLKRRFNITKKFTKEVDQLDIMVAISQSREKKIAIKPRRTME